MANEQYKIYSCFKPVAHSGDIVEIKVSQTLGTDYLHATGPNLQVSVQGPQLKLTEDDISGVYPAPGSTNSPANFVPHIALQRRTLPWERSGPAVTSDGQPTIPWLALLVVTQDDLIVPGSGLPFNPVENAGPKLEAVAFVPNAVLKGGDTSNKPPIPNKPPAVTVAAPPSLAPTPVTVKDLASSDPKTYSQLLKIPGFADATQFIALAVPNATLKKILPQPPNELALLCNAKEVDQDGQPAFFSIVLSGRLPNAVDGNPDAPAQPHMAVLVSLEQRDDIYGRLNDAGATTLVVLHSWTFTPSKGADFQEVCQSIRSRPNGGVLRFGNVPSSLKDPAKAPLSGGFDALLDASGFFQTPLDHTKTGNVLWRGPLRPFPTAPRSDGVAIRAEPEELENQVSNSPVDYSHATAFEIGKLLALADAGIREDLRAIHALFPVPQGFVAMSELPPILQEPYWGEEIGDPSVDSQAQLQQSLQNPWSFGANRSNQSMVGIQNKLGNGNFAGITAAQAVSLTTAALSELNQVALPVLTPSQGQIDIDTALEAGLAVQFPEVLNAVI